MKFYDIEDIERGDTDPPESQKRNAPAPRPFKGSAARPPTERLLSLSTSDGRRMFVDAGFVVGVWEPEGTQKAQGLGAVVFFNGAMGGVSGVSVRESLEEVHAAWRMALGLKGGVQ